MEAGAQTLISTVLAYENLAVVVGCWIVITTAQRAAPEFFKRPIVARLLPIFPLVLCTAALWLPGVAQAAMSIGDKILLGLLLGFAVGHAHKIITQAGLGKDARIKPPA